MATDTDNADYCADLVRHADRARFLSALYAPEPARVHLYALYAFDAEIAKIGDIVHEPMAGEIRLQWWRDVIAGERDGEAMANPLAAALLAAMRPASLPQQPLLDLIEARSFDLYRDPMASVEAFTGYADKTSGVIIDLAARLLTGSPIGAIREHVAFADTALRELAALGQRAAHGKIYLPLDLLQQFGADPAELLAGHANAELHAVIANLTLRARGHLDRAETMLSQVDAAALPALLPLAGARRRLRRLEQSADPLQPDDLPPWRRQWAIWRAARDPRRLFQ
ncbi:MAG: squalene/phytoene synthase family protein [Pseudolabrys sp.]|nr:squalene/phytoene synthase family protein [Pseudolabrys sp.]